VISVNLQQNGIPKTYYKEIIFAPASECNKNVAIFRPNISRTAVVKTTPPKIALSFPLMR